MGFQQVPAEIKKMIRNLKNPTHMEVEIFKVE
jgi:hypothetical protein